MLAKVFGGNSGWDVVFPSNYDIQPMAESELLAPLDHSRLRGLDNLDERTRQPVWDPQLRWSVPYMWGAAGIAFNRTVAPPPRSWRDLWNPRFNRRLTMLDDAAEALGAALIMLGFPLNSSDEAQLRMAKAELLRQKPLVRAYLNAESRDQLVAGGLLASQLWATTASQAMPNAGHLDFVFPEEGFSLYADCAVILRESSETELAHQFLEYLLNPGIAETIAEFSRTATCNGKARTLLPPVLQQNTVLYPPSETLARGQWFAPLPATAQRLRDRMWTEIKSA
jgi:spermidine/putrescine transport system substrate-binding protein